MKFLFIVLMALASAFSMSAKESTLLPIHIPYTTINDTCLVDTIISIDSTGMVEFNLRGVDLNQPYFEQFTPPIILSFSEDINDTIRTYTSDNLGINVVDIFTTDSTEVQVSCLMNVTVATGQEFEPTGINVSINTILGVGLPDITVQMSNDNPSDTIITETTDEEGNLLISPLSPNENYLIRPYKNNNHLNGISTFDLVLIHKHILGVNLLDSPYKLIAADINGSGNISSFDVVLLREVITGNEFLEKSWRFIDASYEFPYMENPWIEPLPETISVETPSMGILDDVNFIGVKIGDVNQSVGPNITNTEERSSPTSWTIHSSQTIENELVNLDFTADLEGIEGYQFTLEFDPSALEFVRIEEGLAGEENFNTRQAKEGVIMTSWIDEGMIGESLFGLVFKKKSDAPLKNLITISSKVTAAEAYKNSTLIDVNLQFEEVVENTDIILLQNTPNPFQESTLIEFNLPTAGTATLVVQDALGKIVYTQSGDFEAGYQQFTIHKNNLASTAQVFYYTLQTETASITKQMVLSK